MEKLHFVGIGGIGMSGLAAMAKTLGYDVTGSDRGSGRPENRRIFAALENQGIRIYPQDGSFIRDGLPGHIVYSTAIEEDNPDFAAGQGIPRLHRSVVLEKLMSSLKNKITIAVTGSCGKSTVTAYMAEALFNLGADPACLNGALSKRFKSASFAGNFRPGKGRYFVFEADESDKSLLNYQADYCIILNIGTDHYSKEELARVFGSFLANTRKGAVLSSGVYEAVKDFIPPKLEVAVFYPEPGEGRRFALARYVPQNGRARAVFAGTGEVALPAPGEHSALNALAVYAMLDMLGFDRERALRALERFDGLFRRTDFAGKTAAGALVYDDYAHNPEKIVSCLETMRELAPGRVFAVFQPHGFGPWGFMCDELFRDLEQVLRSGDRFLLLEPYYAGGTTSFKPTSASVAENWRSCAAHPERYLNFADRASLAAHLKTEARKGDVIVTMGARDNSLSDFASSLADGEKSDPENNGGGIS